MAIDAAAIVFSNLNNNTLSRLTGDRTVAAIPFACRYRLIDFCLSNLVNADVSNIHIVANYNYRSLMEHIGSGKDWDLARREGGINLISPFQSSRNASARMYSTHMDALKSMADYIREFNEEYVILMDADHVLNLDVADVVRTHVRTDANITMVTRVVGSDYSSKNPRVMVSSVAGKITDMAMSSTYQERLPELSLSIFVMKTAYLRRLIEQAVAYNLNSLTEMLLRDFRHLNIRSYPYSGFVASVSSFLDYYRCSMRLASDQAARASLLGRREAPVFTRVHNSVPTYYAPTAHVENSMIADDCIIEGTVINSVISRGVHVYKGSVVKNSILFQRTIVGKNASLNCIVTDKDVVVTDGVQLSGNTNMPFYIQKGRKV